MFCTPVSYKGKMVDCDLRQVISDFFLNLIFLFGNPTLLLIRIPFRYTYVVRRLRCFYVIYLILTILTIVNPMILNILIKCYLILDLFIKYIQILIERYRLFYCNKKMGKMERYVNVTRKRRTIESVAAPSMSINICTTFILISVQ